MKFKISASITDFPLQTSIETFFRKFKETDLDSVEVVFGGKTFHIQRMFDLSQKYKLPITSFHQSPWSGFGFSVDELFIKQARRHGVKIFTFHPLAFISFDSKAMQTYFANLSRLQKRYDITICLENMPQEIFYKTLFNSSPAHMEEHLMKLYSNAQKYDLSLTYDTTHTLFADPQEKEVFRMILPRIKNIHLSSFTPTQQHLSLDKGEFDTKAFLQYLYEKKYSGLLTFEMNYSLLKRMLTPYDFSEIKRSVAVIKAVSDKSL